MCPCFSEDPAAEASLVPSFGRKRAQRGAVSCPRSHSSSCVQGFRSTNSFTMAPKIHLFPKGNRSKPDLEIAVVPEGLVGLLSFGAYCELLMQVWGTQNSELSAHSCGGRSQPPRMTQHAQPHPAPLPTAPPHTGGQPRSGGARPVSQRALREQPNPEDSPGGVAQVQGMDQGLHPSLRLSKIAFLRTGQDKVGEAVPVLLGLSECNGKKALRPWRAGVGPLVYGEGSQR